MTVAVKLSADWLTAPGAQAVCALLTQGGHQAWFVGGCVRNALLGAAATDIDITTDARPERMVELAGAAGIRSVTTGIDHGTVTLISHGVGHEVTTFRRDVETDGRRATVAFADSIAEDAARRDFSMNALYAAPDGTVADPLGEGISDLRAGRLRFIGDPHERIREDYLRILRFFRFHAWYGDPARGIDAEGLAACAAHLDGIKGLSRERVGAEMRKLLSALDPAPSVAAMQISGVLLRVLPGAGALTLTVLIHIEGAAGLPPDPLRRLAALGGEGAARALRLSNAEARRLTRLTEGMADSIGAAETGYRLGAEDGMDVLALRAAMAGVEIDPEDAQNLRHGAVQVFPLRAADLPPHFTGPAIGAALRDLESHWITADFRPDGRSLLSLLDSDGGDAPDSG